MFVFAVMFVFNKLTVWHFKVALQLLVANRLERLMCEDNFGREIIQCEDTPQNKFCGDPV